MTVSVKPVTGLMKLKTRWLQPIGLDIGHNTIRMIQLAANRGRISVLAADKVRVDGSMSGEEERRNFVLSVIKQMLAKRNFRGRDVVSCLPDDKLKITNLRLPEMEADEAEQALRKEAIRCFGLNPNKDAINYLTAGKVWHEDEIKNELILFAASDEVIRSHIAMLEEARLRPAAIDMIPQALFRSFERSQHRKDDKKQTVVFVDVGSRFTTVVFGSKGEISFTKQILIGGENFNCEIASRLEVGVDEAEVLRGKLQAESEVRASQNGNVLDASTQQVIVDAIGTAAEELAKEISLCLRYYTVTFRGERVERAVLSGEEGNEKILLNVLRHRLPVEVEIAQPFKGLDVKNVNFDINRREPLCEWAVAVGLGLKGWEGLQ